MNQIETNQKLRAQDFAQLLAGQHGTFLVSRPGVTLVVVCQEGYSIKSIRSAGSDYPTVTLGGSSANVWEVEKLNNSTEIIPEVEPGTTESSQRRSQSQTAR